MFHRKGETVTDNECTGYSVRSLYKIAYTIGGNTQLETKVNY